MHLVVMHLSGQASCWEHRHVRHSLNSNTIQIRATCPREAVPTPRSHDTSSSTEVYDIVYNLLY